MAAPPSEYMAQLDLIYEFNKAEQRCYDALPAAEQPDFRLYSVGAKLLANAQLLKNAKLPSNANQAWRQYSWVRFATHRHTWDGRAELGSEVPNTIHHGRLYPDPRLAAQNYELIAAIQEHYDSIPEANKAQRREFRNYAIGRTVVTDRANNDATLEDEIITNWTAQNNEDLRHYQNIGRHWHRRYVWETFPDPRTGPADGHIYDTASHRELPRPTANDAAKVRTDLPTDGRRWKYEKTIYRNSHYHLAAPRGHLATQRVVHLFVSIDEFGQVHDRMAVKIQGEHNLAGVHTRLKAEYDVQASLQACDNVLNTRAWSYRNRNTVPACLGYLYLDWAPHGSLHDLLESAQESSGAEKRQFPEPMLWLIFRGLAEALHMMQTGQTVAHNEPTLANKRTQNAALPRATGWQPLTNVDIKLRNVVIGHQNPDWYPSYKTALMIDFGHTAHNEYPDKPSKLISTRPVRYQGIGTPGSRPPEQFNPPPPKLVKTPIDLRSSIWNVGKILWELINQEIYHVNDARFVFNHSARYINRRYRYWPSLLDLVKRCLAPNPSDRPHLNEILWATNQGLADWERDAIPVSGTSVPTSLTWPHKPEPFALGHYVPKHWRFARRQPPGHEDSSDDDGLAPQRHRPGSSEESSSDGHASGSDWGDEAIYVPSTNRPVRKVDGISQEIPSRVDGREAGFMGERKKGRGRGEMQAGMKIVPANDAGFAKGLGVQNGPVDHVAHVEKSSAKRKSRGGGDGRGGGKRARSEGHGL